MLVQNLVNLVQNLVLFGPEFGKIRSRFCFIIFYYFSLVDTSTVEPGT